MPPLLNLPQHLIGILVLSLLDPPQVVHPFREVNGPPHYLPQARQLILVVDVLVTLLHVLLVYLRQRCNLGRHLLHFHPVSLTLGF
jgi:hypothetical protein